MKKGDVVAFAATAFVFGLAGGVIAAPSTPPASSPPVTATSTPAPARANIQLAAAPALPGLAARRPSKLRRPSNAPSAVPAVPVPAPTPAATAVPQTATPVPTAAAPTATPQPAAPSATATPAPTFDDHGGGSGTFDDGGRPSG